MPIPLPKRLNGPFKSIKEEKKARARFFLNIAAHYATDKGDVQSLSLALGLTNKNSLYHMYWQEGNIPIRMAIAIEQLIGRNVLTREQLRPDIFQINED